MRETDVSDQEVRAGARDLAEKGRVMTLATACSGGVWSAPVYYLFQSGSFFFLSDPGSRHIRTGLEKSCSASIFEDSDDPAGIRGVQMAGSVTRVENLVTAVRVCLDYGRKFRIPVETSDPVGFFLTRYHARLYRFQPQEAAYMDNRIRFGFRKDVEF